MSVSPCAYIDGPNGRIAYRRRAGKNGDLKPGIVWLGGYRSDMLGTKAEYLDEWAKTNNRAYLRFDYTGHGESDGEFADGCIGDWAKDAFTAFEKLTNGKQILVGSSMGGWVTSLLAQQYPERVQAIIFIAPAPDFTEKLMWPALTDAQRQTILNEGRLETPSDYGGEPDIFTLKLFEDGKKHLVMNGSTPIHCPVRILQGMRDEPVPWRHAVAFAEQIESNDVEICLTKNGDHRLSEPRDLDRLVETLEELSPSR